MSTVLRRTFLLIPLLVTTAPGARAAETWELIDRLKDVPVGEWVRLSYSRGSEHLLLVAAKDEQTITLEERVREKGYVTSWTQVVIDLNKKLPVIFRERMLTGEIREANIEAKESGLNEDFHALLTARFWEQPGTERVVVPAGRFSCKVYESVFNKKFIRIFISSDIPLYPVKVLMPGYELTIRLVAFGKGMESRFLPVKDACPKEGAAIGAGEAR